MELADFLFGLTKYLAAMSYWLCRLKQHYSLVTGEGMARTLTWLIWGGRSGELYEERSWILIRWSSTEKQKSYFLNLCQHFVGHLLKKAIETTELKNTMVRIKDFGLIWNETQSLLNEMTLYHCQLCTGLNEIFQLWLFFLFLKNNSLGFTFEAKYCSKMKVQLLICETLVQNVSTFLKISFLPCHLLILSSLPLTFDWNYFVQIHSFTQMFRSPWNYIF